MTRADDDASAGTAISAKCASNKGLAKTKLAALNCQNFNCTA